MTDSTIHGFIDSPGTTRDPERCTGQVEVGTKTILLFISLGTPEEVNANLSAAIAPAQPLAAAFSASDLPGRGLAGESTSSMIPYAFASSALM